MSSLSQKDAAFIALDFIDGFVKPLASAIERLSLATDADVTRLCRVLYLRADAVRNDLECHVEQIAPPSALPATAMIDDFIHDYVQPLTLVIDRLSLENDQDITPLCYLMQLQAEQCREALGLPRECEEATEVQA